MRIRHRFLLGTGLLLAIVWTLFALEAREEFIEARDDALARLTTLIERQERAISIFEYGESTVQDKVGRMLDPSGLSRYISAQVLPAADYLCAVDIDGHAVMGAATRPCAPSLRRAVERGGSNWMLEEGGEFRTARTIVIERQPHFLQLSQSIDEAMAPAWAAVRVEVMYAIAASALIVAAGYVWWLAVIRGIGISKRAQTDQRIAHRALESMSQAAFWATADSQIVKANAAAEEMFGYTRAELLSMTAFDLMPDRYKARHRTGVASYVETGHSAIVGESEREVLHGVRKGGEEFPVRLLISDISGSDPLFLALVSDETERQARLETIARQKEELDQLLEQFVTHQRQIAEIRAPNV